MLVDKLEIEADVVERFVDDVNGIFDELEPGTEFVNGKLIINKDKVKADAEIPGDKRTMDVIKSIANSIDEMVDEKIRKDILEEFMNDVRLYGYDDKERLNIFKSGIKTLHVLQNKPNRPSKTVEK